MYDKETVLEIIHLSTEGVFMDQDEFLSRLEKIPDEEIQKEIIASVLSIKVTISFIIP